MEDKKYPTTYFIVFFEIQDTIGHALQTKRVFIHCCSAFPDVQHMESTLTINGGGSRGDVKPYHTCVKGFHKFDNKEQYLSAGGKL